MPMLAASRLLPVPPLPPPTAMTRGPCTATAYTNPPPGAGRGVRLLGPGPRVGLVAGREDDDLVAADVQRGRHLGVDAPAAVRLGHGRADVDPLVVGQRRAQPALDPLAGNRHTIGGQHAPGHPQALAAVDRGVVAVDVDPGLDLLRLGRRLWQVLVGAEPDVVIVIIVAIAIAVAGG